VGVGDTNPDPHPEHTQLHECRRRTIIPANDAHERRHLSLPAHSMSIVSSENIDHVGGLWSPLAALDPRPTTPTTQKELAG